MTSPCYEIVTYTVDDKDKADAARALARKTLQTFPGFIAWTAFSGAGNPAARVDLVAWHRLEDAIAAAKAVGRDPEFADFRASVATLSGMDHYRTTPGEPLPVVAGSGVEIGRFRLKPGVAEEDMREAYARMLSNHLTGRPGWRRQHLVRLDDGVFVDLAFAETRPRAEAICAGWQGQPDCDAFLALIEPESMAFGTIVQDAV